MTFQTASPCDYRLFGKASNRLSLPNLANMSIFKNEAVDIDGNEIGQLQQLQFITLLLIH